MTKLPFRCGTTGVLGADSRCRTDGTNLIFGVDEVPGAGLGVGPVFKIL